LQRSPNGWVVDSSVSIKWYLRDEDLTLEADAIRRHAAERAATVVAPSLARYEVARSLATASRVGRINRMQAAENVQHYLTIGISLDADPDWLITQAWERSLQLPIATYDAVYVALAERIGMEVVTADEKFYKAVSPLVACVHWLGDIQL
jgi:predicted nucleic acid-binding protein